MQIRSLTVDVVNDDAGGRLLVSVLQAHTAERFLRQNDLTQGTPAPVAGLVEAPLLSWLIHIAGNGSVGGVKSAVYLAAVVILSAYMRPSIG